MHFSLQHFIRKGIVFIALLFSSLSFGQVPGVVRCYSSQYDSIRHANDPHLQSNEAFEEWMQGLIRKHNNESATKRVINGVYQIPVIVHVVHDGEAIGTGTNLSAAAIQSQIDVLNEDFRKTVGTPGHNTHPDGADTEIEFCLAKRRPDGTAFPVGEDGINRINRNAQGWAAPPYGQAFVNATIKPYTIATQGYDAAVYMNFWSINLSGGLLGYAQFPTTSLGGMNCNPQSINTDGVVMRHSTVGRASVTGAPGPYNQGRTATHEIGHWLGLRHIWGDGDCSVDDFCNDTPRSDAPNYGCATTNSCVDPAPDPNDMVENYMDYSNDACMNIFTNDQKLRMRLVLENSPIRSSLINSDACVPPAVSDASIVDINFPTGDNCPGPISPQVTLRNRGANALTASTIRYEINGGAPVSFAWSGNVPTGSETVVTLPAFTAPLGIHTIRAYPVFPNGVNDPNTLYDTITLEFAISNGIQPNYLQDFEASIFPPDVRWDEVNPTNDCFEWIGGSGVSSTGVSNNSCALMPNFGNTSGNEDFLNTPYFILPCNASAISVSFDVAYRRRVAASTDELRLQISTNCGSTWSDIFSKSGTTLQTSTTLVNSFWQPGAASDWRNETVSLLPFVSANSATVRFRFVGNNNGNGGNIYIDNFRVDATTPAEIEVSTALSAVLDEGFYDFGTVGQGSVNTAIFTVTNTGNSNLILSNPISITGSGFSLLSGFGSTTVGPNTSSTFSVQFNPTVQGNFNGTVSFGTNDCDEATYNFVLQGKTNTTPPIAGFIGSPTTICAGSTVTYTNTSSGANTYNWTFTGGNPSSATGAGPHVITYPSAGTFTAALTVTNVFGTDTQSQPNFVTSISSASSTLPLSEGFVSTVFPPTGWSIAQTSSTSNANIWARSGTSGNAPSAGNSAFFDNFSGVSSTGNVDDLIVRPLNFSGIGASQMTFDVAYARFDNSTDDQLEVLVSGNCGQTFTTVFSKAGATLATNANTTSNYVPGNWRNETVDLSAFSGSPRVDIVFRNTSDWGNNLYLDNINITGVTAVVAGFTATPNPACVGSALIFTDTSVGATTWSWNFGTDATPATAVGIGPHSVSYSTSGTKNISLSINGGTNVSNQSVVVNSFNTAGTLSGNQTICLGSPTTFVSTQTGGTWSSSDNSIATINASTGVIASISAGTATMTYTVSGGSCPNATATRTVTISAANTAGTLSGNQTICLGSPTTFVSTQTGGTWSSSDNSIATINASTGVIASISAGTATMTYTVSGGSCPNAIATRTVTISAANTAGTLSGNQTICLGSPTTFVSTQTGGTWSSSDNSIATINASAGVIASVSAGTATMTYTVSGGSCPNAIATRTVTISAANTAGTLSGNQTICLGSPTTFVSTQTGGTWSSSDNSIATINASTGVIASVSVGTATMTYTVSGGSCPNAIATRTVTVSQTLISLGVVINSSNCLAANGSVEILGSGTGNLTWTGSTNGTVLATLPFVIDNLTGGTYTISFADNCSSNTITASVLDPVLPTAPAVVVTNTCGLSTLSASGTEILWSTGATSAVLSVTNAGIFTVTQTVSGCTSLPTSVNAAPLMVPSAPSVSVVDSCGFSLLSATGVDLLWSTGSTNATVSVTAGTYTVTQSAGSCVSPAASATALPRTVPTVTFVPDSTYCLSHPASQLTATPIGGLLTGSGISGTVFNPSIAGIGTHPVTYTFTNSEGCTGNATVNFVVDACLSILENSLAKVQLFPNPAADQVTILSEEISIKQFTLYDYAGRIVLQKSYEDAPNELTVDLKNYSSGVYHLDVQFTNDTKKYFSLQILK